MSDLIEALTILRKYADPYAPTSCTHDELWVCVDPAMVSAEDVARLDVLGLHAHRDGYFYSFRFGNC